MNKMKKEKNFKNELIVNGLGFGLINIWISSFKNTATLLVNFKSKKEEELFYRKSYRNDVLKSIAKSALSCEQLMLFFDIDESEVEFEKEKLKEKATKRMKAILMENSIKRGIETLNIFARKGEKF